MFVGRNNITDILKNEVKTIQCK